jgi:myo-inositol-1(or 4)-monophosphatase
MNDWVAFSNRLADASAQVIRPYFRSHLSVDLKADESPVTIADQHSEEAMREMIMKEFPDHGILGEEFGRYNPEAEYQWILDPIDGTKTFITGCVLFGTLIALLKNGQPIIGVINLPAVGDRLIGVDGETRLNGEKVTVRPCSRIEEATLLASDPWQPYQNHDGAAFESLARRVQMYRTWGDCYGYYLVATGFADIMVDAVMQIWDVAPLVPILEGAGGRITDWHGNSAIGGQGAVATGGALHDEVIRLLNPHQS